MENQENHDVLCKKCKIKLFNYKEYTDSADDFLELNFENVNVSNVSFSYDNCCEGASNTVIYNCKGCNTEGTISLSAGGQSGCITVEIE